MKIIFIYAEKFSYKIGVGSGKESNQASSNATFEEIQTAFIHVERKDQEVEDANKTITKFIKQAKWVARKNNTNQILLHSFAHLAETKSDPQFAKEIFDNAQERLENAGFEVNQTPFGYFLDLDMKAPGRSLARVYYEIN